MIGGELRTVLWDSLNQWWPVVLLLQDSRQKQVICGERPNLCSSDVLVREVELNEVIAVFV